MDHSEFVNSGDASSRGSQRIDITGQLRLMPANPLERSGFVIHGVCRDISETGLGSIMRFAPRTGDVYWLEIELEQSGVTTVFARCMRCRFISEDAYEAGFAFFSTVSLSELLDQNQLDSSIELI